MSPVRLGKIAHSDMENLKRQIELWLLTRKDWVAAAEICAQFKVTERQLRAKGDLPGLCSDFAISGDKGFKHVWNATTEEYTRAHGRILAHLKHEARRLRTWRLARQNQLTGRRSTLFEKHSGQGLLLPV